MQQLAVRLLSVDTNRTRFLTALFFVATKQLNAVVCARHIFWNYLIFGNKISKIEYGAMCNNLTFAHLSERK